LRDRVRHLTKGTAIYGAGDAAIQLVNFALLAVYVKGGFLLDRDYGALLIILGFEAFGKLVSRWGLDGAFMRFYYDRDPGGPLERLTSTLVRFILVADAVLLAGALLATPWVGARLLEADSNHLLALRLMLVNLFVTSTLFVPFHLMRMRDEAIAYSALMLGRNAGTTILRIVLVIGLGRGLAGWFLADLLMTLALWPVLWRWMRPLIGGGFSTAELRATLRFGLPRLPHGVAMQALDHGNRLLLSAFIPINRLGVYQNGVTLGTGIKFFMAAFETAWAPFYYATGRQPDAKEVFRKMTTYGFAALVLLAAVTTAVAADVVAVMLTPEYADASRVIPLVAAGLVCQGLYLLTSIGLNLTGRTEFYPVATIVAATLGLGSGFILMPRYGVVGAAGAFLISYAVLAVVAFVLAQQVYPMRYEAGRMARIVASGLAAVAVAVWVVPPMPALAGLVVRAAVTTGVYFGLLWASGFLRATERAFLGEAIGRLRSRGAGPGTQQ